jgi:hypothetical protein
MPSPGEAIVHHLGETLPGLGVEILGHEDVEYAHELRCRVANRIYTVSVAYDWLQQGWWEIFWSPTIGILLRLLGRSEDDELRRLAVAVSQALDSLPGIQERRWYPEYRVDIGSELAYTHTPET